MSGVYIKGMEMPKAGQEIVFSENVDGTIWARLTPSFDGWHEVMSVPPHGRLIDADEYRDEFMDRVYELCSDDSDNFRANAIIDCFDSAPVIIPSEKGGTDA